MQELIDIIVNVLARLNGGENVQITKKSDAEFVFRGNGFDAVNNPYIYEIAVRYFPYQQETNKENSVDKEKIKNILKEIIQEENNEKKNESKSSKNQREEKKAQCLSY